MNNQSHLNALQQEWASAFEALKDKLSTTIELQALLRIYAYDVGELFSLCGVFYYSPNHEVIVKVGEEGYHTEEFVLRTEDKVLGTLQFSKNTPFLSRQRTGLSSSLALLCFPVKHALAYQEAMRQALTDPLTGLGNRAALNATLARAVSHAKLTNTPLSLLMLDVDYFKKINDTHGHPAGDSVLCQLASELSSLFRETDTVFRYGGEEFVVLIFGDIKSAVTVAERTRTSISSLYQDKKNNHLQVTVSIGVTQCVADDTAASLFARSDKALFKAKEKGRNCVCVE